MNTMKFFSFCFAGALLWASCSPTKHLPPNEKLYTGPTIVLTGVSTTREKKTLKEDLEGLTRPKPNSRILGIPLKLNIYNLFRNKKAKSFWGKLRDKFGEPPVLLSQVDIQHNTKVLQSHLENKGYFRAQVTGDTVVRRRRGSARYKAVVGPQYKINAVHFPGDSSALSLTIAQSASGTLLKKNDPFDLDLIKGERDRIDGFLKERGFYFFGPDYILLKTDSTIGNNLVDMYVTIKPETPKNATQIFRINDVYIYSGYSLNTANTDTLKSHAQFYKGYYIIDKRQRFKPYLFEETMQFKPGDVYNRTEHNLTLARLINLNTFKFVKNRFEEVPSTDSAKLDAFYYLTPMPGKSLRAEVTAISRSNNLNGTQLNLSLLNRNLFRSAAQLNFTAYVGSDVQFSGAYRGYNTYRYGAEADFVIPRFVVPFVNLRKTGPYAPRTTLRLGYDILNRKQLFTLNSYRFEYGYTWKKNIQVSQELFPIAISYVQPINTTPAFEQFKLDFPGIQHTVEPQFILGTRYEYLFNQLANGLQPVNAFYFDGVVDVSGNIAGLLTGANAKKGDTVKIYGAPFAQYVKVEADGRYYRKIGLKSTWANRIDIGIGYPYGNSLEVPYIKQFFSGGNNSLRGFRSRSVGPGSYYPTNATNNFLPDQTGDLKLEVNTEFRPHISGPLYGALFVDAGNVWLVNDTSYTHKPGSQFGKNFLNQLAVDAGVGLRLDITIFVIRLDVAFPLRKPWEIPPSVINQINFADQSWRRANIVYNLAIGYPF